MAVFLQNNYSAYLQNKELKKLTIFFEFGFSYFKIPSYHKTNSSNLSIASICVKNTSKNKKNRKRMFLH